MIYNERLLEHLDKSSKGFEFAISELSDFNKKSVLGLNEKDTFVIRKRYGFLDNGVLQTYKNIGIILNMSQQNVRVIDFRTIRHLNRFLCHYSNELQLDSPITNLGLSPQVVSNVVISGKYLFRRLLKRNLLRENTLDNSNQKYFDDNYYLTIKDLIMLLTYNSGSRARGLLRMHSKVLDLAEIVIKLREHGFDICDENFIKELNLGESYKFDPSWFSSTINGKTVSLIDLLEEREIAKSVGKSLDSDLEETKQKISEKGDDISGIRRK